MNLAVWMLPLVLAGFCAGGDEAPVRTVDLVSHVESMLSSRTNGSFEFTGPVNLANFYAAMPVTRPDFWLRDVKNIYCQSRFYLTVPEGYWGAGTYATAISPHLCVTAAHNTSNPRKPSSQLRFVWLLPDGSYYTNTAIAGTNVYDFRFYLMEKTNRTYCRVMPYDRSLVERFVKGKGRSLTTLAFHQGCAGRTNLFFTTFTFASSSDFGAFDDWPVASQYLRFGDYQPQLKLPNNQGWTSGDSGSPSFIVARDEVHLVGVANSSKGSVPIAKWKTEVEAAMGGLCAANGLPPEKLSFADYWGQFTRYPTNP